jgi:hypothetical protein
LVEEPSKEINIKPLKSDKPEDNGFKNKMNKIDTITKKIRKTTKYEMFAMSHPFKEAKNLYKNAQKTPITDTPG